MRNRKAQVTLGRTHLRVLPAFFRGEQSWSSRGLAEAGVYWDKFIETICPVLWIV
jgi:hypothetical protein